MRAKMDWKKWLGYNLYKKLWSVIGGRPWTFVMRDFAYQNPVLLIVGFFLLGMWLRTYVDWNTVLPFLVGLLLAHLFWGTKWRKGQKGD